MQGPTLNSSALVSSSLHVPCLCLLGALCWSALAPEREVENQQGSQRRGSRGIARRRRRRSFVSGMLRAVLIGSGSSGSSFLLIARDLLYYGLVAAWHRLRSALGPPPPPCPPLPAAEALDGESLLSIVIPTFNEAGTIAEVVRSALRDARVEVIISDGGSRDGTQEQARAAGARVLPPW